MRPSYRSSTVVPAVVTGYSMNPELITPPPEATDPESVTSLLSQALAFAVSEKSMVLPEALNCGPVPRTRKLSAVAIRCPKPRETPVTVKETRVPTTSPNEA